MQRRRIIILRGIPGSGKSSYAKRLISKLNGIFGLRVSVCSADDYFIDDSGNYVFDREKLGHAHGYCKREVESGCRSGADYIVVDNTNTRYREMRPYHNIAEKYDYEVIVRVIGNFDSESIKTYAARNVHNVPISVIENMAKRFAK